MHVGGTGVCMLEEQECACWRNRSVHVGGTGVCMLEEQECACWRNRSVHVGGTGVCMLEDLNVLILTACKFVDCHNINSGR